MTDEYAGPLIHLRTLISWLDFLRSQNMMQHDELDHEMGSLSANPGYAAKDIRALESKFKRKPDGAVKARYKGCIFPNEVLLNVTPTLCFEI